MNTKLLCIFSPKKNLDRVVDEIVSDFYGIEKIFVFHNSTQKADYYLTFNIDLDLNSKFDNYLVIHRKKDSNTLYTVNALNILIKKVNNGILDKTYKLDWSLYKNMLLLSKNDEVNKIPLDLDYVIRY